jgi:hypothetical protein
MRMRVGGLVFITGRRLPRGWLRAAPSCFGRAATSRGLPATIRSRGTDGPDVIVGLTGFDRVEGV